MQIEVFKVIFLLVNVSFLFKMQPFYISEEQKPQLLYILLTFCASPFDNIAEWNKVTHPG